MFCNKCGAQMDDFSKFCSACGAQRSEAAPPPPPTPEYTYTPPQPVTPVYTAPEQPIPPVTPVYAAPEQPTPPVTPVYAAPEQPTPPVTPVYAAPEQPIAPATPVYAAPEQPVQPYGAQQLYSQQQQPYAAQQPYAQQPYAPQQYNAQPYGYGAVPPPPSAPSKKKLWKVFVPVCAVLVLAICVAAYFLIFASPKAAVGVALSGLKEEMSSRLNGTPLKAVALLPDVIENGQIIVDFDYTDYWGDNTSGSIALQMDTESRSFAVLADASIYGMDVDLKAYMDSERIALKSELLDSNYYGFEYDTFREDIAGFGSLIGLDGYTTNTLAEAVDMINEAMNQDTATAEADEAYTNALTDFFKSLESTTSKAPLPFGNSSEKYQRVDYVVTKDALVGLLNDYYDLMKNDKTMREQIDSYFDSLTMYGLDPDYYGDMLPYGTDYDDFLDSFEEIIDMFEREYNGVTSLSFYIDDSRLVAMTAKLDITVDGETGTIDIVCDFGLTPEDTWVITATLTTPDGDKQTMALIWKYSDNGDKCVNEITLSEGEGRYANEVTFSSTWSRDSGDFTFAYDDGYDYGEFSGNFKETAKGFVLEFDNLADEYYDEIFALKITVEKGVKIDNPQFIGLDKWNEDLLYKIEDMVYRLS